MTTAWWESYRSPGCLACGDADDPTSANLLHLAAIRDGDGREQHRYATRQQRNDALAGVLGHDQPQWIFEARMWDALAVQVTAPDPRFSRRLPDIAAMLDWLAAVESRAPAGVRLGCRVKDRHHPATEQLIEALITAGLFVP